MNVEQLRPFILLVLVISLIILGIIASKTKENIGNPKQAFAFKGMLFSFMLYALVDLRLLTDNFYTGLPRLIMLGIMGVGFASMSFACYFWFIYVSENMHLKIKSSKLWYVLTLLPLVCICLILFTPLNRLAYEVTDAPVFKGALMFIISMDYVYLIFATIISLYKGRRAKTRVDKKKYYGEVIFILFFTFSGGIIVYLLNLPAIELLVLPVVLKLFVDIQDSRIYTDALTKLNNRRRIDEYIEDEIKTCSPQEPLTIIMIDVDFFKSINDILGHEEGDKALVVFSDALTKVVESKLAMAARWGGDEFLVAGKEKNLASDFRNILSAEIEKSNALSYVPSFSIGVFECTSNTITVENAISEADASLYVDKEEQHRQSERFHEKLQALKKN